MSSPFERLKLLFSDHSEVLELLDPRLLDNNHIEGEETMKTYRESEIFVGAINLYVTGRTSVGKTSLGNQLYGEANLMKSSGHINCTDSLNFFRLKSNLRYFDLPGAGSADDYENINRAILCLNQIGDHKVDTILIKDFTKFKETGEVAEQLHRVNDWVDPVNQSKYAPDVYLYIGAPHRGVTNGDLKYMHDVLQYSKEKFRVNRCVFALNLYTNDEGVPVFTKENVEDFEKSILKVYEKVFNQEVDIVHINTMTGSGFELLTQQICKILPIDKLGTLQTDIKLELKKTVDRIKHKRFLRLLICIASKLAVHKADEKLLQNPLLYEAYASVYIYGVKTFCKKDIEEQSIADEVKKRSEQAISKQKQDVTIIEHKIESQDITEIRSVPQYEEETIVKREPIVETVTKQRPHTPIAGLGIRDFLFGTISYETKEIRYDSRTITVEKFVGYKQETITIDRISKVVGQEVKVIGEVYLQGGYDFIEGIFSLGLGLELSIDKQQELTDFSIAYNNGNEEVKKRLEKYKPSILDIILNNPASEAEEKLISILSEIFDKLDIK